MTEAVRYRRSDPVDWTHQDSLARTLDMANSKFLALRGKKSLLCFISFTIRNLLKHSVGLIKWHRLPIFCTKERKKSIPYFEVYSI